MQPRRWAAVIALALAAAACTSSPDKPSATGSPTEETSPTESGATGTGSPTATGTGSTTATPTGTRTGRPASLTKGTAHLKISGGYTFEKDLPLDPNNSVYSKPPENSGGLWRNDKNEQVGLFGSFKSGKTSDKLFLNVGVPSLHLAAISKKGECAIVFTSASASRIAGTFDCPNWKVSSSKTITVTGTFNAS